VPPGEMVPLAKDVEIMAEDAEGAADLERDE
jgi:hypothetical protein